MEQLALEEQVTYEAEYALESAVKCPHCQMNMENVRVVRLLRMKVNFTSSLPRRGYVVICPDCRSVLPASVGSRAV